MEKLKFKKKIRNLDVSKLDQYKLNNLSINLINVEYNPTKAFEKISKNSNGFLNNSFEMAFKILKKGKIKKFINGPISKKKFIDKKFIGFIEKPNYNFLLNTGLYLINRKEFRLLKKKTYEKSFICLYRKYS